MSMHPLPPLPVDAFNVTFLNELAMEALQSPSTPEQWTAVNMFDGTRPSDKSMEYISTADIRRAADPEQDVPRHVVRAFLCYGPQLTQVMGDDTRALHCASRSEREVFVLPPLDMAMLLTDGRIADKLFNKFLFRATGAFTTLEMTVILPIVYETGFFTVVLTAKDVTVHSLRPADAGGDAGRCMSSVVRVWADHVQRLLRNKHAQLSIRKRELLSTAMGARRVDLKWCSWETTNPTFPSRHERIDSLAVYYSFVYGITQSGLTSEPCGLVSRDACMHCFHCCRPRTDTNASRA